jgi:hypothetical protein
MKHATGLREGPGAPVQIIPTGALRFFDVEGTHHTVVNLGHQNPPYARTRLMQRLSPPHTAGSRTQVSD